MFVVLTKTDLVTAARRQCAVDEVSELLRDVCPDQTVVAVDKQRETALLPVTSSGEISESASPIPLFHVSSVNGSGLDLLQAYLAALEPKRVSREPRGCVLQQLLVID